MAETATQPNNALVRFRGQTEREMPSVSQAQNRFMHATAEGETDAPPSVGKEFIKADAGTKVGKLPKRVGKKKHSPHMRRMMRRGMISEKAMEKMSTRETPAQPSERESPLSKTQHTA